MSKGLKFIVVIVVLLIPSLTFSNNKSRRYIEASLANIREKPKAGSKILAQFPVGLDFMVTDSIGEWYAMDSILCSESSNGGFYLQKKGWIHKSIVSDSPVNGFTIKQGFLNASTLKDSILWTERWNELQNKSIYKLGATKEDRLFIQKLENLSLPSLQSLYERDTVYQEKVVLLDNKKRLKDRVYIAHTHFGQVRVIGFIDTIGEFTSLEFTSYKKRESITWHLYEKHFKTIEGIQHSLINTKWYSLEEEHHADFKCFAPYIFPGNDTLLNMTYRFNQDIESDAISGISLGKILQQNYHIKIENVFATSKIKEVINKGIFSQKELLNVEKYIDKMFPDDLESFTDMVYRSLPNKYVDITIRKAGNFNHKVKLQRAIFNKKGKLLWPPKGVYYHSYFNNEEDHHKGLEPSRWFQIEGLDDFYYTIVPFSGLYTIDSGGHDYGFFLLRLSEKGLKTFLIRSQYAGC